MNMGRCNLGTNEMANTEWPPQNGLKANRRRPVRSHTSLSTNFGTFSLCIGLGGERHFCLLPFSRGHLVPSETSVESCSSWATLHITRL